MIIIPSGLLDTIVQSSGGTTVQNGYGGLQLHKKAYQRKVKSSAQQAQRNNFTSVQTSFRALTIEQQEGWYSAATPPESGFQLYSRTNNALVAAGADTIPAYVSPVTPFNPTLTIGTITYDTSGGYTQVHVDWTGTFTTEEIAGWLPYFKWSGWIPGSVFRFPDLRLSIAQAAISIAIVDPDSGSIGITWGGPAKYTPGPVNLTDKTKVNLGWINTTTGQIVTGTTFTITPP